VLATRAKQPQAKLQRITEVEEFKRSPAVDRRQPVIMNLDQGKNNAHDQNKKKEAKPEIKAVTFNRSNGSKRSNLKLKEEAQLKSNM
jgi:hypothetical protein